MPDTALPSGIEIGRPDETLRAAETFVIAIEAEDVTNLGGFEFTLEFDPGELQVQDVMLGGLLGSTGRLTVPLEPVIDNVTGSICFGAFTYGTMR